MAYNNEYPSVDAHIYNDDWLLRTVFDLKGKWEKYFPEWETRLDQQDALIKAIQEDLQKIVQLSPGFMENLISGAIKNVWFGLNQEGYFVAYVPKNWQSIQFATTGYDTTVPTQLNYGHLVLYERQEAYAKY